jgi:hypothetical protein
MSNVLLMEQNLSERERKQRLLIGIGLVLASIAVVLYRGNFMIALALLIVSAGLFANYFTCFCGLKELIMRLKNAVRK